MEEENPKHKILIEIDTTTHKSNIKSTIPHDDLVMYFLIEAIYQLRNHQYDKIINMENKKILVNQKKK